MKTFLATLVLLICSLACTAASLPLRVNTGGSEVVDERGIRWQADQAYSPGAWGFVGGDKFKLQNLQFPFYLPVPCRTQRYCLAGKDPLIYRFDGLPPGHCSVKLHFAELYFLYPTLGGKRVFDVALQGKTVLKSFDAEKYAGPEKECIQEFDAVIPPTGTLEIKWTGNGAVNGIEILPDTPQPVMTAFVPPEENTESPATDLPESPKGGRVILVNSNASSLEVYAARELQKYLYARTDECLPVCRDNGTRNYAAAFKISTTNELTPQSYRLLTTSSNGNDELTITGGDAAGALYGVYGLLENHYGISFFMSGDVIPEKKVPLALAKVDETQIPAQKIRGFTNHWCYMQGSGTWSLEDWKYCIDQMARMRMNLLSVHNYIGEGYRENWLNWGQFSLKNLNQNSSSAAFYHRFFWPVSDYPGRGADLFTDYAFGCAASMHDTYLDHAQVWERCATTFQQIIAYAHRRGVKVALGTEFHWLPEEDQQQLCESILAWYPNLDYLTYYRHEGTQLPPFVPRIYSYFKEHAPKMGHVLTGWGSLNPTQVAQLPADVIVGPFAAYSDKFEDGHQYGSREYWAGPWLEEDNRGDMHYMPRSKNLANTLACYQHHASNMSGFVPLTWRLTDAIDPRLWWAAEAPWSNDDRFKDSRAIYREYSRRCYGENNADVIAEILNQNEALTNDTPDCRAEITPSIEVPAANPAQFAKAEKQIVAIDACFARTIDNSEKERLLYLKDRLLAVEFHIAQAAKPWDETAVAAESWTRADLARVTDMSSLGQLVSNQQMVMQEHAIRMEDEFRSRQRVKFPSEIVARETPDGVALSWHNEEEGATGFNIYHDQIKLNAAPVSQNQFSVRTADIAGEYRVTAVGSDGAESVRSAPATVDTASPRIVMISPPTAALAGMPIDITARVSTGLAPECVTAELRYRKLGVSRWTTTNMARRCRAIFAARISGEAVGQESLEYYVVAKIAGVETESAKEYLAIESMRYLGKRPSAPELSLDSDGQTLCWKTNGDGMLWYRLYRSKNVDCNAGPENAVTYFGRGTNAFRDLEPDFEGRPLSGRYYYRITAVDWYGRESLPSVATPVVVGTQYTVTFPISTTQQVHPVVQ